MTTEPVDLTRTRIARAALTLATTLLGLTTRSAAVRAQLPDFVDAYAGDTLWGAMVCFLFATLRARARLGAIVTTALVFSYAIETSQLYHAPFIDRVRATTFGHLVLGEGFLWSDLVCYTVGVLAAALVLRTGTCRRGPAAATGH